MKYFKESEFACKCGCGYNAISKNLAERLDLAREGAGVPFIITSGCRCAKHNNTVGGIPGSAHTKGLAVDIAVNKSNRKKILDACEAHFKRIGVADSFIHVDIDPSKPDSIWQY